MSGRTLKEHEQYSLTQTEDKGSLIFSWKYVEGLSIEDMQVGILEFARQCNEHKPASAVIDARQLDQNSPALGWVSSQKQFPDQEEYMSWWMREIVPIYNESGMSTFAVATGNPNSPGEIKEGPPGLEFKMGYFNGLDDAIAWNP